MASKNETSPGIEKNVGPWFCISAMLFTAMAAGMGWGIRGQYGHETGAMMAGTLAALTLLLFFAKDASALAASRAAAMAAVAIGVGGSTTYAQSIGLTQAPQLIGNWEAWRWGMLGLFIKGGIWIGYFGLFLGMGLGGKRYRALEMLIIIAGAIGLVFLGTWWINTPFDPAHKILPKIYFSYSWYFEPDNANLKPRPENWGGLLTALVGLTAYVGIVRRDWLAVRLAFCAFLAGGIGQAGGQCIQSYNRWNPDAFSGGWLSQFEVVRSINWWNMMETGFGFVFGGLIALAVWLNRRSIAIDRVPDDVTLSPTIEAGLLAVHMVLLLAAEFLKVPSGVAGEIIPFDFYIDYGLVMCLLPLVGIAGGKFWPTVLLLIVVAAPIMGKEMRDLCMRGLPNYPRFSESFGWLIFVIIPIAILVVVATALLSRIGKLRSQTFAAVTLLTTTWLYFGLNTFFFGYAWPWKPLSEWTYRTPNQLIFIICTVALTLLSIRALVVQRRLPTAGDEIR
jgi:hypothetical protein